MPKITSVQVETGERNTPIDVISIDVLPLPSRGQGLTPMLATNGNMQIPLPNRSMISVDVDGTAHMYDPDEAPILDFDSIKTGTLHASQVLTVGDPATDGWRVEISGVDATYPMRYWDGTTTKFSLDKNGNVVISGSLVAGEIHIPDEDTTANSFHVDSTGNVWLGCTSTQWAAGHENAKAYVINDGSARFQKVTLDTDVIISGIQPGSEISIQGWTSTLQFVTDGYRKINWSVGSDEVISLLDGSEYTIVAGTTGDMADFTFIYLEPGVSTTVLQFSTDYADAVGPDKILIAIANLNSDTTSEAIFQVYGGMGGNKILVDNLCANSASVNEFISNSAQIANAIIGDAHIDGTLTVGVTDADVTADNQQNVAWLTDAGALAYEDLIGAALCDTTLIVGGYIKTSLLTANNIITGTLNASVVTVTNLTGASITSLDISSKTLTSDQGTIGGFILSATTLKSAAAGNTYIELDKSVPHFKMQGSTSGDVIQMAVVGGAPLLESYKAGVRRMRLDEQSLKFYDSSGNLRSTLTGGTTGSGTTGLVGTNNMYFPTSVTSQKLIVGTSGAESLGISVFLGDIYFDTVNKCVFPLAGIEILGGTETGFLTCNGSLIVSVGATDLADTEGNIYKNNQGWSDRFRGFDGNNWRDFCFYDERADLSPLPIPKFPTKIIKELKNPKLNKENELVYDEKSFPTSFRKTRKDGEHIDSRYIMGMSLGAIKELISRVEALEK